MSQKQNIMERIEYLTTDNPDGIYPNRMIECLTIEFDVSRKIARECVLEHIRQVTKEVA